MVVIQRPFWHRIRHDAVDSDTRLRRATPRFQQGPPRTNPQCEVREDGRRPRCRLFFSTFELLTSGMISSQTKVFRILGFKRYQPVGHGEALLSSQRSRSLRQRDHKFEGSLGGEGLRSEMLRKD